MIGHCNSYPGLLVGTETGFLGDVIAPPELYQMRVPNYLATRQLGYGDGCMNPYGTLGDVGACPQTAQVYVEDNPPIPEWVWWVAGAWAVLMLLKRGGR